MSLSNNYDFYSAANNRWRKKRAAILRRDGYQCQECLKYGRAVEATHVHHIKELDLYPEFAYEDSNLESVCAGCQNRLHPEKGTKSLKVQRRQKA